MASCGFRISTERGSSSEHNHYIGLVPGVVSRSVPPPLVPKGRPAGHINLTSEPWEPFPGGIGDEQTPEVGEFQFGRLPAGQHRIPHMLVVAKDGIVPPLRHAAHHSGLVS